MYCTFGHDYIPEKSHTSISTSLRATLQAIEEAPATCRPDMLSAKRFLTSLASYRLYDKEIKRELLRMLMDHHRPYLSNKLKGLSFGLVGVLLIPC